MPLFAKLLITALVLAVLLPFTVLKGKDGRPLMSVDDLKMPDVAMPDVPGGVDMPSMGTGREDIIYQWRDSKGELHFTSSPPPAGIEYTSKGYDPDANLIQSIEVKHEDPEPSKKDEVETESSDGIGNPYSPAKIDKLFKDAKNVQKLMDDRMKQQEAIMGR